MSESFDKLMKLLEEKGEFSDNEMKKIIEESGDMTSEEHIELSLARLKKKGSADEKEEVTLEQYLEATKTLDSAKEGSPEYAAAQKIVEAFEAG